ncbi:MAG: polyprenyl diphosphate synthase [Gemmatimonadota bacterium]|nr:polyprenyl diphosphate synthase [Gemmatimonadota bacterium]MDH3424604.1 polyprenyl diphosphate synthase [Gemmatimonadota bacterium]
MADLLDRIRLNGDVPAHVAIIMDGNGRWAAERGLPRHLGHREGMKSVRETISAAVESGIDILTMFAFSTENWNRPRQEVTALMRLLQHYARRESDELKKQGVEVHVLGELDRMDESTRGAVDAIVADTRGGAALRLNLMISYGGREELIRSARLLAERVRQGEIAPHDIDESMLEATLFTRDVPSPDLLIRTSGECRISNFMLWQLAYTELHITPVYWPDFGRANLFEAILDYQSRDRRFGRVASS